MAKLISKLQSSSWFDPYRRLSFSLHSLVAREPNLWLLYQPYIWWRTSKRKAAGKKVPEALVQTSTKLVIDGFQGSANGFAVAAFKQNQTTYVQLAHHLHSPAEIIKAIEQKTPVVLLIREPIGAVISLTSRWPYVSVQQGLQSYIKFYTKLTAYEDGYVVSTFEQTTKQIDQIIDKINTKFKTNFEPIDIAKAQERHKPKDIAQDTRSHIKQQKKQELARPENAQLLAEANQIYSQFEAVSSLR